MRPLSTNVHRLSWPIAITIIIMIVLHKRNELTRETRQETTASGRKCGDITSSYHSFSLFFFSSILNRETVQSLLVYMAKRVENTCLQQIDFFSMKWRSISCVDNDPIFHALLFAYAMRCHAGRATAWTSCINCRARDKHHQNRTHQTTDSYFSSAYDFNYFIETNAEPNPEEYLFQLLV